MRTNLDLNALRAFVTLVELGQFNRAADAQAITPSALSRRIGKLEEAIGGRLLHRTTRAVTLTALGATFHARVADILASLDDCVEATAAQASGKAGKLVVACFASLSATLFPRAVAQLHRRFADVQVVLRDGNGTQVREAVLTREAEFGVTVLTAEHDELHAEPIGADSYLLACPRGHRFARRKQVRWPELAGARVLSFSARGSSRRQIDPVLREAGIPLPWFDEVDQLSSMLGYLSQGQSAAVLPGLMAPLASGCVCVPLVEPVITRHFGLIRRKEVRLGPAALALWKLLGSGVETREHGT